MAPLKQVTVSVRNILMHMKYHESFSAVQLIPLLSFNIKQTIDTLVTSLSVTVSKLIDISYKACSIIYYK